MSIKPLLDRVVVEPKKTEEKTAGGIILPGSSEKKATTEGKVVAVGPGARLENGSFSPLGVSVGDTVIFSQYGGTDISVNGMNYVVLTESNILGIIQ